MDSMGRQIEVSSELLVERSWGRGFYALALGVLLVHGVPSYVGAQTVPPPFSIEDVLSPAFPYHLVTARKADRIA